MNKLKNISLTQKKILGIGLVVFLVFMLLWGFVYLPSKSKIQDLEENLNQITNQVDLIKGMAAGDSPVDNTIQALRQRYQQVN